MNAVSQPDPGKIDLGNWRFIAALIAMFPVFLLNAHDVFMVTQIMGPSHAILAFIAQRRMGYYANPAKAWFFIGLFAAAILAGLVIPLHFVFFVASFFVLHNLLDDIVLFNTKPTGRTQVVTGYAFLIFLLINIDSAYNQHLVRDWLPYLALGLPVCAALMWGQSNTPQFRFLFYITALAFVMLALSYLAVDALEVGRLPVENVFCFLVLTHYINWYIFIWLKKKARGDAADTKRYVRQCLISNGFFVALFVFCINAVQSDAVIGEIAAVIFVLIFHFVAFHVFTFMHLATTVRIDDYIPKFRSSQAV